VNPLGASAPPLSNPAARTRPGPAAEPVVALQQQLAKALTGDRGALTALPGAPALDRRDQFLTLLAVYDLHTAPLEQVGDAARFQHHPAVAAVKSRLDGGFDDLVSACQVGLSGSAKVELAQNYWDEMGNGDPAAVHTVLHDELVAAIAMPRIPREQLPVAALERAALGGLLATNRWLQPEMLGALGLLELQAGPRCRLVLQAFDRLGAPAAAYPFYLEHAEVDPRHGKDWLEKAVGPTVAEHPTWGPRIVKGAWWRSTINLAFFQALHRQHNPQEHARSAA